MINTRKFLLTTLLVPLGATLVVAPTSSAATPSAPATSSVAADALAFHSPEAALDRVAHPLRTTEPRGGVADLRPFGAMVGDARVVGVGEATHSSHEFVTVKHRLFRYLVEEKGFRTFAFEAAWSSGVRIDAYLTRGEGDLKQIMDEEFQGTYRWWNNAENRDLLQWMRAYNVKHPGDPVRFVGDDNGFAGPGLYDKVSTFAAASSPDSPHRSPSCTEDYDPPPAPRPTSTTTSRSRSPSARSSPHGPGGRWTCSCSTRVPMPTPTPGPSSTPPRSTR
ncbi:hypothetical protein GCM10017562_02470 [Streptomyces roseofulvus]